MNAPAAIVTNTTQGMLYIKGIAITRDIQQQLWQVASGVPIREYYIKQYQWPAHIFDKIDWKAQQAALMRFSMADQQRIRKFIHKWLPTGKNLHRQHNSNSPQCPLCSTDLEDNTHMFHCQHPTQTKSQQELLLYIAKQQHSKEMPEMAQLLEWALINCSQDKHLGIKPEHHPVALRQAIKDQNIIGWNQILYGRISKEFGIAQDNHYRWQQLSEITHNGSRWTRDLIFHIWKTTLALWSNRNKAKHDNDTSSQTNLAHQQLLTRAQHCYEQMHLLTAVDRNHLFHKTLEERIQDNPKHLVTWVDHAEQIIRLNKQEDPHIIKCRKKMEEYFQKKKHSLLH
jgi:hypothetical protein